MSVFEVYIQLGFHHIVDLHAFDHLLFIVALCAVYRLAQWKNILILVTAFTIGHSLTLALATLRVIIVPTEIIEFLIPITILLTSLFNLFSGQEPKGRRIQINYALALFFGLIHGMGFSNYLRVLLGFEESIITPLLAFNIGLELGQLLIVGIVLLVSTVVVKFTNTEYRDWRVFVSGGTAGMALMLAIAAKFW